MLAGTIWLYARQVGLRRPEVQLFSVSSTALHSRYSVRADAAGVGLYRPPFVRALRPPRVSQRVASLVGKLANDQVRWPLMREVGGDGHSLIGLLGNDELE